MAYAAPQIDSGSAPGENLPARSANQPTRNIAMSQNQTQPAAQPAAKPLCSAQAKPQAPKPLPHILEKESNGSFVLGYN